MPDYRFDTVRLALADSNRHMRQTIRGALRAEGFNELIECSTFGQIEQVVSDDSADLLLCDAEVEGGNVSKLIHDIRHHRIGKNPFLLIVVMLDDPTMDRVKTIVNSGSDDLLVKPVSRKQMMDRVELLINGRRPFVVTHDYIGPDRRKSVRSDDPNRIPQLHVPNVLRAKALGGNVNAHNLQRMIDATTATINEHKMERYAFQIGWLVERIMAHHDGTAHPDGVAEEIDRLVYVAEDLSRRLRGTVFAYISELSLSLIGLSIRLRDAPSDPQHVDLELLPKMAQAIYRAFDPAKTTAAAAQEISRSINAHNTAAES